MSANQQARIKVGMVGGGPGAMMGDIHRRAMRIEGRYELVAGALSSDPQRGREAAATLGIESDRAYTDYQSLIEGESGRADGIDAIVVVTPNHLHVPIIKAALEHGLHVVTDKPLGVSLEETLPLQDLAAQKGLEIMLTYVYCGYAAVHQARQMVRDGDLGEIRTVEASYTQGYMSEPLESSGWREDPEKAGEGGVIADIGTHAYHMASFITELEVAELSAETRTFVPERKLHDYMRANLRYKSGAIGSIMASQISAGYDNSLEVRVSGTKGSLFFEQEKPEELWFYPLHGPAQVIKRNCKGSGPADARVSQLPGGLPEGYNDAMAQLYRDFADRLLTRGQSTEAPASIDDVPGLDTGIEGMRFVERVLESGKNNTSWITFDDSTN